MMNLIKNEFIKLGKLKLILIHLLFLIVIVTYYYVNKKVITEDFILSLIPFIGVGVSILFGGIMSSEYNDGTFRIYLVKPVKRTKIYIAKLLTIFLTIVSILIHNFTIYALFTHDISVNFTIKYLSYSHSLLLISTIIIMLSTIIKSSALTSGIVIMLLTFGFSIFELLSLANLNFLEYTFLPYLDLNILNKLNYVNAILSVNLSLKKSIIINLIYSIIFIFVGVYLFNKKDIRN